MRAVEGIVVADDLVRSPAWYPLEVVEDGSTRLLRLDEAAYQAASFLDQRLLRQGYGQGLCPDTALASAATRLTHRAHYIFHIGHVGSTLVSRLVGAHPALFSLREPALLRTLALAAPGSRGAPRLEVMLALLSRTWSAQQRAVVKVTSFVSELAAPILSCGGEHAAIFMFARPLAYLGGIFGGPNSRAESRQLGAARLGRLAGRLAGDDPDLQPRSEGEWIAMSWLCEMTALCAAAQRLGGRVRWVDFDAFLAEPVAGLADVLRAFGVQPEAAALGALVSGPLMRRYSKAPEHPYDASLRHEVRASAQSEHAQEIRRGMLWLERSARVHPLARLAFEMSPDGRL